MSPGTAKLSAKSVLTAPRRPVTRYRPWVIAAAGALLAALVGFAFVAGFSAPRPRADAQPAPPPEASAAPADLDPRLPVSYDDPLALRSAAPAAAPQGEPPVSVQGPASASGPSPAEAQRFQETQAAHASPPFFGGAAATRTPSGARPPDLSLLPAPPSAASGGDAGSPKERFIARAAGSGGDVVAQLPTAPLSRYEIKAGAIVPAALITGLNSDLPGPVIAQVTEPVFDHLTGQQVLIPQGTRLIGRYDSQVSHGQDRVLVVWTRLVFPDGRSLSLGAMSAADATGAGGLSDRVDTHLPALARAAGLSTLISIGGAAAQNSIARGSDNLVLQDAAGGLAGAATAAGQRVLDRDLQRPPTLRVRPGWPVRLIVDKDLILPS